MKLSLTSRRVIIAALGILSLLVLGIYTKNADAVAMPIAVICAGVAGANALQKKEVQ